MLNRTLPSILLANFIVCIGIVYGFWDVGSNSALINWAVLMLVLLLFRGADYLYFKRIRSTESIMRARWRIVISIALSGLLLSVGSMILIPTHDFHLQLIYFTILLGFAAGSSATLAVYFPALSAYFATLVLPNIIYHFSIEETIHHTFAWVTIAFSLTIFYFGRVNSLNYKHSLRIQLENAELSEDLKVQKNEADQANQAKSKFLAAASHDLRQPLHALSLFTSVLDESTDSPKTRRVVDQIKLSVDALKNLFNALLDISRLDAGVIQAEKINFYLQPMLDTLTNDFKPLAREKGLRFDRPVCPHAVHSDPTLLERVLRNYISNAIRYTDSGEIKVSCIADGINITINVIDAGVGIAEKHQQVIFEEFYQLSNPERDRSKGLGLGLAIVQRMAKLLGHPIAVDSQLGKGSTFSICVPQAQTVEEKVADNAAVTTDEQLVSNKFVVIVDDEASIREGMQSLLQKWGYEVICAADKQAVLNLLRQQNRTPDGIITDYRLPDHKTGIDVIQAIHNEYNKTIPALIVTGDTSVEELREANTSGFEVLHKPVAPIRLRTFLRHI